MNFSVKTVILLLLGAIYALPIHSNGKIFWVAGDLVGVGESSGRSFFSVRNDSTGKVQHVLCQEKVVKEIAKAFAEGEKSPSSNKIHINVKAKIVQIGSPLLTCTTQPLLRGSNRIATIQNPNSKRIIGQVLEADPESGLLTIQSAQKKSYLKVAPDLAAEIHRKLSQMQIHNIDDTFYYDRNLGYFVGSE